MSGAQPNDTDIQPNKILIHHRPEATTYILKVRTQFCKLFRHKSPAELPVKVRHGHNQCFCKLEASIAQSYIRALLHVQNWGWMVHTSTQLPLDVLFSSFQAELLALPGQCALQPTIWVLAPWLPAATPSLGAHKHCRAGCCVVAGQG